MQLALLVLLAVPLARADLVVNNAAGTIIDNDLGILIESIPANVRVHADAGEVELEGGELHFHSPGEIHIEGELPNGFVHIEATGTGQVNMTSQTGLMTIESFSSNINIHADVGEVEVEGGEVHVHSPGFVHLEGEGAVDLLIENTGTGGVTLRTAGGPIVIGNGLQASNCAVSPLPPSPCLVAATCPPNRISSGISLAACPAGTLRVICCEYSY